MSAELPEGTPVWVDSDPTSVYEIAKVVAVSGSMTTVRKSDGSSELINSKHSIIKRANDRVADDVTALTFFHEAAILHNLEMRSTNCDVNGAKVDSDPCGPYSRMGSSVLVCVNPLEAIPEPEGILGKHNASSKSHPYGIAEVAYQQLVFAASRAPAGKEEAKADAIPVNQSIVVGGESGAGKTESSKMVLKHLVQRVGASENNMDKRLLSANPILEAFGNASTLRNHNSSRFGRFLKVHLNKGKGSDYSVSGASLRTYLLERSRVTHHEFGERNFHVFYQFLQACKDGKLDGSAFNVSSTNPSDYGILKPYTPDGASAKVDDAASFTAFNEALSSSDISDVDRATIFRMIAAILHLGNVTFDTKESSEGDIAVVAEASQSSITSAAKMLGLDVAPLGELFTQRTVVAVGETMVIGRTAAGATQSRDAYSRALYSNIFAWLVKRINKNLGNISDSAESSPALESLPFIGVLDIFGFESFERNDYEQLLINYANEALQGTFNRQIFEAELHLFQREGLMGGATLAQRQALEVMERMRDSVVNSSKSCLELIQGSREKNIAGLLKMIAAQGKVPQPSDAKMLQQLHKLFRTHENFVNPHPRERHEKFIIAHYAGQVQYTVGGFLRKDTDRIPAEIDSLMTSTSDGSVKGIWEEGEEAASSSSGTSKSVHNVSTKFSIQMRQLIGTLEASRCSFIRCIKPNSLMMSPKEIASLKKGTVKFFDRRYVAMQLKNLSIPQTAELLSYGFPTRVEYAQLVESYKPLLPKDAIKVWSNSGGGADRTFVAGLFAAFGIPAESYKLGLTKVFFESGMMDKVNAALEAAGNWKKQSKSEKKAIVSKFKSYFARARMRTTMVKIFAVAYFIVLSRKNKSARIIQASLRMRRERELYAKARNDIIRVQSRLRYKNARRLYQKLRKEHMEKLEAERIRLLEEEKEKARLAEIARKEAEEQAKREAEAKQRAAAAKAAAEAASKAAKKEAEAKAKKAAEEAEKERLLAEEKAKKAQEEAAAAAAAEAEAKAAAQAQEAERLRQEEEEKKNVEQERQLQERIKVAQANEAAARAEEEERVKQAASKAKKDAKRTSRRASKVMADVSKFENEIKKGPALVRETVRFRKKWVSRFLYLDKERKTIDVYSDKDTFEKKRAKSSFNFSEQHKKNFTVTEVKGEHEHILAIVHPLVKKVKKGFFFACTSKQDAVSWRKHIEVAILGGKQVQLREDENMAKALAEEDELSFELLFQLDKIERQYQQNKITEEEYKAHTKMLEQSFLQPSTTDQLSTFESLANKQVSCSSCGKSNNTSNGLTCYDCGKQLQTGTPPPPPQDDAQSDTSELMVLPSTAKHLGDLACKDGKLVFHSAAAEEDLDFFDNTSQTRYPHYVTWYPANTMEEPSRWKVLHSFKELGMFHMRVTDSKEIKVIPPFPAKQDELKKERKRVTKSKIKKRLKGLDSFFISLLKENKADDLRESTQFDLLFGIQENTYETQATLPSFDSEDSKAPLSEREASDALELAVHLQTMCRKGVIIAPGSRFFETFDGLSNLTARIELTKADSELKDKAVELENQINNLTILVQDTNMMNLKYLPDENNKKSA